MTGPDHYIRAEQLLCEVRDGHQEGTDVAGILAAAQVHATLALAAATALIAPQGSGRSVDVQQWRDAAGGTNG